MRNTFRYFYTAKTNCNFVNMYNPQGVEYKSSPFLVYLNIYLGSRICYLKYKNMLQRTTFQSDSHLICEIYNILTVQYQ